MAKDSTAATMAALLSQLIRGTREAMTISPVPARLPSRSSLQHGPGRANRDRPTGPGPLVSIESDYFILRFAPRIDSASAKPPQSDGHATGIARPLLISFVGNDPVHRDVIRLWVHRAQPRAGEADADGTRADRHCRDGPVVEAAAVAQPVVLAVEADQRHQQRVRLHRLAAGGDR